MDRNTNTRTVIMIEIRLIEIAGLSSALIALHLPFGKKCNSNIDCTFIANDDGYSKNISVEISKHDRELLRKLISAGDEHAKVVRGIVAYLEISAPRYWWAEMDTYRIGREQLASESTMHIQGKGLSESELVEMKSELKEGTIQKRIIMFSYQTLKRIYKQRHNHRLPQWREFCEWIKKELPLSWIIVD